MKKYVKQLKKTAVAVLVAVAVMVMSVIAPAQIVVHATQNWQTAYVNFLRGGCPRSFCISSCNCKFAIYDMNGDGVPELFLAHGYALASIFTLTNGNIKDLGIFGEYYSVRVLIPTNNNSGVFIEHFYRSDGVGYTFLELLTLQNGEINVQEQGYNGSDNGAEMVFHDITEANIATHILGVTANANSHPFAVELQKIINNLPIGHTFGSATLFNLDERGEQQGVVILTREVTEYDDITHQPTNITIVYMVGNDIRRLEAHNYGGASDGIMFRLLDNNMLAITSMGGDGGHTEVLRLQNGELQCRSLYMDVAPTYKFGDWERYSWGMENRNFITISENRYYQLRREFGLGDDLWEKPFPDNTAQILAMQATAASTQATANANSHPFAVELQRIINNLPIGHTLESATLFNLDERGEQQGVLVLIDDSIRGEGKTIIIYMVGNDVRRFEQVRRSWLEVGNLLTNNMLALSFGDEGASHTMYRLHNGELQSRTISGFVDYGSRDFDFIYSVNDWGSASRTTISENKFDELMREFGLGDDLWENTLPDNTAQILAMQATPPAPGVTVNGQRVNFAGQPPAIVDGRTLVPVRGVFEELGFTVSWNQQARQATLTRASDTIVITIDSATFTTNGTRHTLDVPAQVIGGRTMLPIRAVLQSVGYNVRWDGGANTVVITT
jgi:hypothetical protein